VTELARAHARKELAEGEAKLGEAAASSAVAMDAAATPEPAARAALYTEASVALEAAISLFGQAQQHQIQHAELATTLGEAQAGAVLKLARATARLQLSRGEEQVASRAFEAAITLYQQAQTETVSEPALSSQLEEAIAEARALAKEMATGKLQAGQSCLDSEDWTGAIAALESGLEQESAYDDADLTAQLRQALARARAHDQHDQGVALLGEKKYEAAIAALQAGLDERTGDDQLSELLRTHLTTAVDAKQKQDAARAAAQGHLAEGDRLMAGFDGRIRWKDSITKAIVEYREGLALREETNGEEGWEGCMATLEERLAAAQVAKQAQDEARAFVAAELEACDKISTASDKQAETIAKLVERLEAAKAKETNDSDMTAMVVRALDNANAALAREAAARKAAAEQLSAGEQLMAVADKNFNTIDNAIAAFESALEQETHDDMHKAKIKQALRLAQLAKQAQDTAREAAQAKYEEGKELLTAESWDGAIVAFTAGLKEEVNDDSLSTKLQRILRDANVGKARAADIKAVTEQIGDTEIIFLSGPPIPGDDPWTKTATSVYGTYRGDEQTRALINEEFVDRRFPFFTKFDGLCLYRDFANQNWAIDSSGNSRTSGGYHARVQGSGASLPASAEWQCRSHSDNISVPFTLSLLSAESEVAVWEAWLPASHGAQQQLGRITKQGAISIECPGTLPEDDQPSSITMRLDGEYTFVGVEDGFPRYASLDRGQPSGGLQLYHLRVIIITIGTLDCLRFTYYVLRYRC
jgi:hypothetical protein